MNTTNRDYFTFNVHNSMLLVGQTGSGKTELVWHLMRKYEAAMKPDEFQYVLFDLKQVEFDISYEGGAKQEYLWQDVITDPRQGLESLNELADLSAKRAEVKNPQPTLLMYVEECDMAAIDQERFDASVMKIIANAGKSNIKFIYSTSRPSADVVSDELIKTIDLVLAGQLASEKDAQRLGVEYMPEQEKYSFIVHENGAVALREKV